MTGKTKSKKLTFLAKALGVKPSELKSLARVSVSNPDGSVSDVNVQATLKQLLEHE